MLSIYKGATEDECCLFYVNLAARSIGEMFFKNFTGRIVLEDVSNDWSFYLTIVISTILVSQYIHMNLTITQGCDVGVGPYYNTQERAAFATSNSRRKRA